MCPSCLTQSIQSWPTQYCHLCPRYVSESDRIVGANEDCVSKITTDLCFMHIERGDWSDISYVILVDKNMHESGNLVRRVTVPIELQALDKRRCAVTDADYSHSDGSHRVLGRMLLAF